MSAGKMVGAAIVGLIGVLVAGWAIDAFGDWMSARSDALWWQVLPWVLLAVFWAIVGYQLWCRRDAGRLPSES
jgi:hypothetical protein